MRKGKVARQTLPLDTHTHTHCFFALYLSLSTSICAIVCSGDLFMWSCARPEDAPCVASIPPPLTGNLFGLASPARSDTRVDRAFGVPAMRVVHAHHELSANEAPFSADSAMNLAASARAVATPFTVVRYRSRDAVVLDYREHYGAVNTAEDTVVTSTCTTLSIDRHWLTLRKASLVPDMASVEAAESSDAASERHPDEDLTIWFDAHADRAGSTLTERSHSSPAADPHGYRSASRASTARTDMERPPSLVYSTRWRHEDALLLTEDNLVRVLRGYQDLSRVVVLSRTQLFTVDVQDAQGSAAPDGAGPLRLVTACELGEDVTVNALCAAHWSAFATLVGSSDGTLKLVDTRVPTRTSVVLSTAVPQPFLGNRQHTACILSCCALGDSSFRVACGLGAANGEVAIADLRRPELTESALRSRRAVSKMATAKRALLRGALCAPTGCPIADMHCLPDGGVRQGSAALCLAMVDVCGTTVVATVADLEHQRVSHGSRRSRGPPTLSHIKDDDDTGALSLAPSIPHRPPTASAPQSQPVIVVEALDQDEEGLRQTSRGQGEVGDTPTTAADRARRRTVSFSDVRRREPAAIDRPAGTRFDRLPSPEVVASAWPWRAVAGLPSRSPSLSVSSPMLRPSGARRGGASVLPEQATPGAQALEARVGGRARSVSTAITGLPAHGQAADTQVTPALASARPSPQPTAGVLSSTDLRCAVVLEESWTGQCGGGRGRGGVLVISTQPSAATTSWYGTAQDSLLGELVPFEHGVEAPMQTVTQNGSYAVAVNVLGPLICIETARGGTYCLLPQTS